jgi:hypothetical protein
MSTTTPSGGWSAIAVALSLATLTASALAEPFALPTGEVRLRWETSDANARGPLAAAQRLNPALDPSTPDTATAEWLLRQHGTLALEGQSLGWSAELMAWQQRRAGGGSGGSAGQLRFNELQASVERGAWGFSAGKKVVAWDVGFGFRPNDMVQHEVRRRLLDQPLEGRPLLQAEHFGARSATTLVWVNPQHSRPGADEGRGDDEAALALRHYVRDGGLDAHGFARWGEHTGASLGAAAAWVADEAWALHGSARWLQRHDGLLAPTLAAGQLSRSDPWQPATLGATAQALVGLQWTGAAQQSLLMEAWHDGSAPSDAAWDRWRQHNRALAASPGPAAARAGNLAWQAGAFDGANLRRDSLFLRLAWQPGRWSWSVDALLHPADGGHLLTAGGQWQGERWRLNAALRFYGGPADAVLAQLPQRRAAVLAAAWLF